MKPYFILIAVLSFHFLPAQSVKREEDILFKKYMVRSIDLDESANMEIFGQENTPVSILLDAYCSGKIKGYKNARLKENLSEQSFEDRLSLLLTSTGAENVNAALHIIELGEYLIFDKHTSDFFFSQESLTIFIPAEKSYRGIQEPLISFSYNDCSKIFQTDPLAYSLNPLKNGRNINFSDLFKIRLFNSAIVKIGNSNDLYFDQKFPDQMSAFLAAKEGENRLTEYLYKLYHPE